MGLRYTSRSAMGSVNPARDRLVSEAHDLALKGLHEVVGLSLWSRYHMRLRAAMAQNGIVDPQHALGAALYAGIDASVVCTSLLMEAWGGRNVWGSDPGGSALPIAWRGGPVTPSTWNVYWANVQRGMGNQGCGGMQLTSTGLQALANKLGGCWLPGPNYKVGAIFMRQLLAATGGDVALAYQHYNGSGPAAVVYGQHASALERELHSAFVAVR